MSVMFREGCFAQDEMMAYLRLLRGYGHVIDINANVWIPFPSQMVCYVISCILSVSIRQELRISGYLLSCAILWKLS